MNLHRLGSVWGGQVSVDGAFHMAVVADCRLSSLHIFVISVIVNQSVAESKRTY
jgi:hypothetical protein